jgi:hypothetical protein
MAKTETEVKKLALALLDDLECKLQGRKFYAGLMITEDSDTRHRACMHGKIIANEDAIELVRKAKKKLLRHK